MLRWLQEAWMTITQFQDLSLDSLQGRILSEEPCRISRFINERQVTFEQFTALNEEAINRFYIFLSNTDEAALGALRYEDIIRVVTNNEEWGQWEERNNMRLVAEWEEHFNPALQPAPWPAHTLHTRQTRCRSGLP